MGVCNSQKATKSPFNWLRASYSVDIYPVGKGHFGSVFKGKTESGEKVAIKIVSKKELCSEERRGVKKEAMALDSLDHPSVLRIYDHHESEDYMVLVTEYVEGNTLQQVAREKAQKARKFPEEKAADIARQLLQALDHCHRNGFMHRDVKPENVILTPEGSVKLIDFGLAEKTRNFVPTLAGTPLFIAPEVIDSLYNERCDVWSVGVLIYVLLTG